MAYIELNMVRAGVVSHPVQWKWCSFHVLTSRRQRYRLIDRERLLAQLGGCASNGFEDNYAEVIERKLAAGETERYTRWTESIAVGTEEFVRRVEERTFRRVQFDVRETSPPTWIIRETGDPYG